MSSLFQSEAMARCQLILPSEAAYTCISKLGELSIVQFIDLNSEVSTFQRKFVIEIKRCEEMERKLRFVEKEAIRNKTFIHEQAVDVYAPPPREMTELEASLATLDQDLSAVINNFVSLKKNEQELLELKNVLLHASTALTDPSLLMDDGVANEDNAMIGMQLNIVAGVIERKKVTGFERMLWRITKGNIFLKLADIGERFTDPLSSKEVEKASFLVFFQGEELKTRVKKVCEGFHCTLFPCPQSQVDRMDMLQGVNVRLEDLRTVIAETVDHRQRLLSTCAKSIREWYTKVRKIKSIYHCLNMFNFDVTQEAMVAECWIPEYDLPIVHESLKAGGDLAGSSLPPILNIITSPNQPPTFNRTNKYTAGYQTLVDAYGANSYREINPAAYTIATFPFLFAVMFGDCGHGLIMLLFGLWLVLREDHLHAAVQSSEIFRIFFGGRYIITMMGAFSIYTGLIYNDMFSKSLNIFGTHWGYRDNFTYPLQLSQTFMLDPGNWSQYEQTPYYFGIDPAWQYATNKISFLNGYKMKISLIFGLIHMAFGLTLSLWNKINKKLYSAILLEFLPQIIFLVFIFCYLIFLIFYKWVWYYPDTLHKDTNTRSEHCAPNLLIIFINMMLFKNPAPDAALAKICQGHESYMFPYQRQIQMFLVVFGILMIPIMLFGKPIATMVKRRRYSNRSCADSLSEELINEQADEQAEEESFGDIMIYQGIHTIEYVLGSVSHTASYLRLWALSLAHSQLSEVLWNMVMAIPLTSFGQSYAAAIVLYVIFAAWAVLTISILVLMEGLSAFLHTLRLHWVEFQSKFYDGQGVLFVPFSFAVLLRDAAEGDKEALK